MKIISCCSCSLINSFTWVYLLSFSLNIQERLLSLQTQQSIPTIQTWLALILPQQLPSVISLASDTSGGTGPFVDQSLFPAPPSSAPPTWCNPKRLCSRAEVLFDKGIWKAWTWKGVLGSSCSLNLLLPQSTMDGQMYVGGLKRTWSTKRLLLTQSTFNLSDSVNFVYQEV